MSMNYDNRSVSATPKSTNYVVDAIRAQRQNSPVLETEEFLAEIRRRAKTDAEVGRLLGLPSSRVAELFSGKRRLRYDEAKRLADHFLQDETPSAPQFNAAILAPILAACLKHAPEGGWTPDQSLNLARAVEYGLGLLATSPANQASEDAIAVAGQAALMQLRGGRQPE